MPIVSTIPFGRIAKTVQSLPCFEKHFLDHWHFAAHHPDFRLAGIEQTSREDLVIGPDRIAFCPLGKSGHIVAGATGQGHRDNRLLAALSPETFATLGRDLKQVSFPQGKVMYDPGAPLDTIYFPQSGLISLMIVTRGGTSVEAAAVGREGAVGLHGGNGRRLSLTRAVTQIGGTFSVIGANRFEEAMNGDAHVRDLVARYTELLWAEAQQTSACNALHDASSRLSRCLLQSADRLGSDDLHLTHETLAQMLGTRRTTVTLLLQAMQSRGLIRTGRGQITIADRKMLEACACECYHVIHHNELPLTIGVNL